MPCRDYDDDDIIGDQRKKIDTLTRLLCLATDMLESARVFDIYRVPKTENEAELYYWWKEHKKMDEARKKKEAERVKEELARQAALAKAKAKLSPEERKLLGLR